MEQFGAFLFSFYKWNWKNKWFTFGDSAVIVELALKHVVVDLAPFTRAFFLIGEVT